MPRLVVTTSPFACNVYFLPESKSGRATQRRRRGPGVTGVGGLGFAVHLLWFVLIAALILWVLGFFAGGVEATAGGRRRWFRRW